ncbi:MAG: MBL fold metallo-hydrolase [Candidatus Tectomicrobia bacterium]|uniref:MBL fold metallo-hydrolase n=1 Tax=Tectimicrobiota bacterium TaxID=2528274 RepID=A0A933GKJ2_UNCTE|nr:MBL fold metallo-hydrolase [Candidatus Tectomicrobia bacterium]
MTNTEVAKRVHLGPNPFERSQPIAEHGFSALIRVKQGDKAGAFLFDTGVTRKGILYNMDALEVNVSDIQTIVLSHGHPDHSMGLLGLIDRLGTRRLSLLLHPDAFLGRKLILPNGTEINVPPPKKTDLQQANIDVIEEIGPSLLLDGMVLISGEVARITEFEKGFPIHYARRGNTWEPDPQIMDDQCAIINVRGKGLVIITGCGHAGIINIIHHAQNLTGIKTVYAVIGGFHLSGGLFESIIPVTIETLRTISPRYVVPCHCTGWSAVHQIARAMPGSFIANSVGTNYIL